MILSVHLIIATPGRILDLMNKRLVKTEQCRKLVLDEVKYNGGLFNSCVWYFFPPQFSMPCWSRMITQKTDS